MSYFDGSRVFETSVIKSGQVRVEIQGNVILLAIYLNKCILMQAKEYIPTYLMSQKYEDLLFNSKIVCLSNYVHLVEIRYFI